MPKFVSANVICTVATMIMIGLGLVIARDLFGPWLFMLGAIGILGAVLMAIGTRGATRIYWLGFSVAALGYSGYSWQFDRHGYAPPYHGPELTVQALWQMRDRYVADTLEVGPPPGSSLIIRSGWSDAAYNPGREKTFFLIGHMGGLHGMGGMFSVPEHPTLPSNKKNRFFVGSSRLPESQDRTNPFEVSGGNPFGGSAGGESGLEQMASTSDDPFDEISQDTMAAAGGTEADQNGGGRRYAEGDIGHFFFIGHCAWTLLFGWLGGHFTCLIYQRSRPPNIPT